MAEIVPNVDKTVDTKDFSFRFKKDKLGNKRANLELKGPVPSVEGVVSILEKGGKGLELLFDCMYDTIRGQIYEKVSENEALNQDNFPWDQVSWEAIANMPKEDRRSSAIAAEVWEAFAKDYITVMPGLTGKSVDAVTNATIVYLKKFAQIKTDKKSLGKLKEQLGLYMETPNAEQFTEVLDLLLRRVDAYLAADDITQLTSNL
jgi:hypothetical protein